MANNMTREEAIQILKEGKLFRMWDTQEQDEEALRMAIEALSEPSIVRCKDCLQKHIGGSVTHYYWYDRWDMEVDDTDYRACVYREKGENYDSRSMRR